MAESRNPTEYVTQRPPILQATLTLGIRDAEVARIVGVKPMVVSEWATGKRPIPKLRRVALWFIIARMRGLLLQAIERDEPGRKRRRLEVARQIVTEWGALALHEIGGTIDEEMTLAALALLARTKDGAEMAGARLEGTLADKAAGFLAELEEQER